MLIFNSFPKVLTTSPTYVLKVTYKAKFVIPRLYTRCILSSQKLLITCINKLLLFLRVRLKGKCLFLGALMLMR